MNKTVLVSFKERNKVLRIRTSTVEKEFACLKEQFCRAFNETLSEGQFVTFQRFDSAWDSFVDLEDDDAVEDRDKLKVVITEGRAESTLAENTSNRDTRTVNSTSRDELEVNTEVPESYLPQNEDLEMDMEYEVTDVDIAEESSKQDSSLSPTAEPTVVNERSTMPVCTESVRSGDKTTGAIGSSKYVFKELPKHVVVSSEELDIQFPDPYIVPVHFSQDVTECLSSGKMTKETLNAFLSGVASHVFQIKRKPSREDLINVSRAIIVKYPFLRSPTGSPYGEIIMKLNNKLKEKRRPKRPRSRPSNSITSSSVKPVTQKKPAINNLTIPSFPNGEDYKSFERYTCELQLQYKKSVRNEAEVKRLMELSFPQRRREIVTNGHLFDIKKKFPFLQEPEHILIEMQRIMNSQDSITRAKQIWQESTPKIIKQAKLEGAMRIREKIESLTIDELDESNSYLALVLLAYLLPDCRTKPESDRIIQFCHGGDIEEVVENSPPQPMIIIAGDLREPEQAFLCSEKKVLGEIKAENVAVILLSTYYSYNLCYPKGTGNLYSFLEASLFGLNVTNISLTVSGLFARLSSI